MPPNEEVRTVLSSSSLTQLNLSLNDNDSSEIGKLELLKQRESELSRLLAEVRRQKLSVLRDRPLTIGVVGFGRFGQFIARTFCKYAKIIVTSRSDYTEVASGMGVTYVPLSDPDAFFAHDLDVVVLAVSILSFEKTVEDLVTHLPSSQKKKGPLIVDVLSVKEHPRDVLLEHLPADCDILCTHPMFGPDSGKHGWHGLNFVYERTRVDGVLLDPKQSGMESADSHESFLDNEGQMHSVHEHSEAHVEGMDRMERFLSIWEEEGCRMVPMSCAEHDAHAANSQFLTHLMGRILGAQGLNETPIDTKGFESVLKLVESTTADSFDLFYGLYKYNQNSLKTILHLQSAMDDVIQNLRTMEKQDTNGRKKGNSLIAQMDRPAGTAEQQCEDEKKEAPAGKVSS